MNRARHILVVEDDPLIREMVAAALRGEGFDVAVAPHGAAALAHVQEHGHPDLIVLDLRMPVMDGLRFAAAYHRLAGRQAPLVVMTAAVDATRAGAAAGAAAVLAKPFDLSELVSVVHRLSRRKAA